MITSHRIFFIDISEIVRTKVPQQSSSETDTFLQLIFQILQQIAINRSNS